MRCSELVDIQVPQGYTHAARKKAEAEKCPPKLENGRPVVFYTYFFFPPLHPSGVITDLGHPAHQQP